MSRRSNRPGGRRPTGPGSAMQERQRRVSGDLAAGARRRAPQSRRGGGRTQPQRSEVLVRDARSRPVRIRASGMLLRFISCGILSVAAGLTWRLTRAPSRLGPTSVLLGTLILLSGFVVGGGLWYVRDLRRRARQPRAVDDEYIVFSFVVFAVVPFLVLALVLAVYVIALLVGFG